MYLQDCQLRRVSAFPVTAASILVFVIHKCQKQNNAVSAPQWASHVKGYALMYHRDQFVPWTQADSDDAMEVFKGLRKQIGYVSKQAPALTSSALRQVYQTLHPVPIAVGPARQLWVAWTYVLLVQQAALRPCEATCGNLQVQDITFVHASADYPAGLELRVWGAGRLGTKGRRKRGLQGPEEVFVRQREDELDVVAPLQHIFTHYQLHRFPHRPLLTWPDEMGNLAAGPMTADDLTAMLVRLLTASGVQNAQGFSARSCRSGRRTDLQDTNTSDDAVNMIGRWATVKSNRPYRRRTASIMALQPATGVMVSGSASKH